MNIRITIALIALITTFSGTGFCQEYPFSLLTERYVERPLAMHRGQLQVNSGYEFSMLNRIFDSKGNSLDLTEEGITSAKHLLPLDIRYGILEFIQARASLNYARMGQRTQNLHLITYQGTIYHSETTTWKGFDNLFLGIDLTAPYLPKMLNWVVSGGISLPLFDHQPDQPTHIIEFLQPYPDSMDIRYQYHHKFGNGVPVGRLGTSMKLRFNKLAVEASFHMNKTLKEGESVYWQSRLTDGEIEYREITYQYDLGQTFDYYAAIAYQAIDWLAVVLSFDGIDSSGGWTTETGKKVGTGNISLHSLGVGYEIQVSPNLRLNQYLQLPVSGKDMMAYWIFQTGVSVNFIP